MVFKLFNNMNAKYNQKAQLSVEFILIVLVVLILIEIIILPLRDYSEASIKDITSISYLESNVNKIQQAISDLNAFSEGKMIVNLHIPEDSNFYLVDENNYLNINYYYSSKSSDINDFCVNNVCSKELQITGININSGINTICKYVSDPIMIKKYVCTALPSAISLIGPIDSTLSITKESSSLISISQK